MSILAVEDSHVTPPSPETLSSDGENSLDHSEELLHFRSSNHLNDPTLKRSASSSSICSYTSSTDSSLGNSEALAQDWFSCGALSIDGRWFKDEQGRICLLRGVNLCGNSKLPTKPSSFNESFFDHRNVSFVGRPFPLDEAHHHLARLKAWGLTFVRLLVPWEALEHAGPGIYDEEYIDYLIDIIKEMPKYGIRCFIDPHQDAWSRFSGGSGAPGWTFEVAGMDMTKFKNTGAAYVTSVNGDPQPMVWPTNYTKLASSTMFTLFWAGDVFAPNATYQGTNLKDLLQGKFIDCYKHLARRLRHLDAVIGFEVMNEPHPGYIGLEDFNQFNPVTTLIFGDSPSALQSFALGDGMEQAIEVWVKSWPYPTRKDKTRILNGERERAWIEGHQCIWRQHGVWTVDEATGKPKVLEKDYFKKHPQTGRDLDFYKDFYVPFVNRYAEAIQSDKPEYLVLIEPLPNEPPPKYSDTDHHKGIVYAPHWYDLKSLFTKSFNGLITHDVQGLSKGKNVILSTYFGLAGAKKNYSGQVRNILQTGLTHVGTTPCVIGECGIPMDINEKEAFETGDYTHHSNFLDAVLCAMERNLVNFTLWNYNPSNDNINGDYWNGEDFSIYSPLPSSKTTASTTVSVTKKTTEPIDEKITPKQKAVLKLQIKTSFEDISNQSNSGGDSTECESEESQLSPTSPVTPFDLTPMHFKDDATDEDHYHHLGGRVLDAVLRPYAAKIPGEPESMVFNMKNLEFTLIFKNYTGSSHPAYQVGSDDSSPEAEIFIPNYHYKQYFLDIRVSDGSWRYVESRQTLYWRVKDLKTEGLVHTLRVSVKVSDDAKAVNPLEKIVKNIITTNEKLLTWVSVFVVVAAAAALMLNSVDWPIQVLG